MQQLNVVICKGIRIEKDSPGFSHQILEAPWKLFAIYGKTSFLGQNIPFLYLTMGEPPRWLEHYVENLSPDDLLSIYGALRRASSYYLQTKVLKALQRTSERLDLDINLVELIPSVRRWAQTFVRELVPTLVELEDGIYIVPGYVMGAAAVGPFVVGTFSSSSILDSIFFGREDSRGIAMALEEKECEALLKSFFSEMDRFDLGSIDLGRGLSEILSRGYKLEAEGRELASKLQMADPFEQWELLDRVASWAQNVNTFLSDIWEELHFRSTHRFLRESLESLIDSLALLFDLLSRDAKAGTLSETTRNTLREVAEKFEKYFGQRILWGSLDSWWSIVNNATAAFHRLLDILSSSFCRRYLILSGRKEDEELAKAFVGMLERMRDRLYYLPEDLNPSVIIVKDDEILMRLGSAAGHAARIDRKRGVLEYYDTDEDVCRTLLNIIRKHIPVKSYEITDEGMTIEFEPTHENLKKLCAIMPLAISMDIRIDRKSDAISENLEKVFEEELKKELISDFKQFAKEFTELVKKMSDRPHVIEGLLRNRRPIYVSG